jgi:hypothetical protein
MEPQKDDAFSIPTGFAKYSYDRMIDSAITADSILKADMAVRLQDKPIAKQPIKIKPPVAPPANSKKPKNKEFRKPE